MKQILVLGLLFYIGYACGKHDDSGTGVAWANDAKLDQIIAELVDINSKLTSMDERQMGGLYVKTIDSLDVRLINAKHEPIPTYHAYSENEFFSKAFPVELNYSAFTPLPVTVVNEVEVKEASAIGILVRQ